MSKLIKLPSLAGGLCCLFSCADVAALRVDMKTLMNKHLWVLLSPESLPGRQRSAASAEERGQEWGSVAPGAQRPWGLFPPMGKRRSLWLSGSLSLMKPSWFAGPWLGSCSHCHDPSARGSPSRC